MLHLPRLTCDTRGKAGHGEVLGLEHARVANAVVLAAAVHGLHGEVVRTQRPDHACSGGHMGGVREVLT